MVTRCEYMGGIRGSGFVSTANNVLEMSVKCVYVISIYHPTFQNQINMVNASFPKCIMKVIHTHLWIIGICFSY